MMMMMMKTLDRMIFQRKEEGAFVCLKGNWLKQWHLGKLSSENYLCLRRHPLTPLWLWNCASYRLCAMNALKRNVSCVWNIESTPDLRKITMLRVISIWQNLEMLLMKPIPVGNKDVRERRLIVWGKKSTWRWAFELCSASSRGKNWGKNKQRKENQLLCRLCSMIGLKGK